MLKASLLGVPIYTLAKFQGMGESVAALRKLGLPDSLEAHFGSFRDLGDVPLARIDTDEGESNLLNFNHFLKSSMAIRQVAAKIGGENFAFFLGGECGMIVGCIAGLKLAFGGTPGVLWMDSHGDFNTPETTPSGFIGGMCLAFACGRGPKLHEEIERSRPLVGEERLVHIGSRALDPPEMTAMNSSRLRLYSASDVHMRGAEAVAKEAASYLASRSDWILCHLDVDVIDPSIIPAVNYPERNGLNTEQVAVVLEELRKTGRLRAFDLAAYDPTLDGHQISGRRIIDLVSSLFS